MFRECRSFRRLCFSICFALFAAVPVGVSAQTLSPAPTLPYTSQLVVSDAPVSGAYDFEFKLFDGLTGNTQIGVTSKDPDITVADGVFFANLKFGTMTLTGSPFYLETFYRVHTTSASAPYTMSGNRRIAPTSLYSAYALLSGSTSALQGVAIATTAPSSG